MRKIIMSLFIVFILMMGAIGTIAISPIGSVFDDVDMTSYMSQERESQPEYTSLNREEQVAKHKEMMATLSSSDRQVLLLGRAKDIGGAECSGNPDESTSFAPPYYWEPAPGQYSRCYVNTQYVGQSIEMYEVDPIMGGWSFKAVMSLEKGDDDCFGVTPGKRYAFDKYNCVKIEDRLCIDSDGGKDKYTYGYVRISRAGSSSWYYDSCDGSYRVLEKYCDADQTSMVVNYDCRDENMVCEDGRCVSGCLPIHNTKKCCAGHVYWYDGCGQMNDRYALCSHGCENGACLSAPTPPTPPTPEPEPEPEPTPPTDPLVCNYCEGNNVNEKLIYDADRAITIKRSFWDYFKPASRSATLAQTCEEVTTGIYTSTSNHLKCLNGEPMVNFDYFKPKIVNVWIKHEGEYELIEGTTVPEYITQNWEAGTYVDVLVEVDNSDTKVYHLLELSEEKTMMDRVGNSYKGVLDVFWHSWSFRKVPVIGWVIKAVKGSDVEAGEITPRLKKATDATDWINVGILEVGFYANSVADKVGYGYSRTGYSDLEYDETIRPINACQGAEDIEGWKQTSALLLTPRISQTSLPSSPVTCRKLDETNFNEDFFGWKLGGACNIIIENTIKIPTGNDHLADGRLNQDPNGDYILHVAIFDRCYRPDKPVRYLNAYNGDWMQYSKAAGENVFVMGDISKGGTKFSIGAPSLDLKDKTCCKVPAGIFGWFPDYRLITITECNVVGGSSGTNMDKCDNPEYESCYRCNDELGKILGPIQVFKGDCKSYKGDWTTSKKEADESPGCRDKQLTKTCYSCATSSTGAYIEEQIPEGQKCSLGYHEDKDYDCSDLCGGDCAANEVCDYGTCRLKGNNDEKCGGKCDLEKQECLKMDDGAYACITTPLPKDNEKCYSCDENSDPPYIFKLFPLVKDNDPVKTCDSFKDEDGNGLLTLDYAKATCKAKLDFGTAFINPDDSDEWCLKLLGHTAKESCAKKSFPRSNAIELNEIHKLDQFTAWDLAAKSYWNDESIPLCFNEMGDAQCQDGSICMAAKKTSYETDNKKIFDALKPIVVTNAVKFVDVSTTILTLGVADLLGWTFDYDMTDAQIEHFGICTFEEQGSYDKIRRSIGDMFGWDADDDKVLYVMIGGIIAFISFILILSKPSAPRYIPR